MQDETPQKDTSPAQPTEAGPESAQEAPPVPGAEQSTPDGSENKEPAPVDQAPTEGSTSESVPQEASDDVDEPGDSVLPEELEQHIQEGEVPPDNVDQEG